MSGGLDDFLRTDVTWDPPTAPMVVDASRSGVVLAEREPDEVEPDTSAADFEDRMNRVGHRTGAEAELAEEPRAEVEDGVLAEQSEDPGAASDGQERSSEDPPGPSDPSQAENGSEVIEASVAQLAPQSEAGTPVTYVADDPEDTRRLAPSERRCTEKTRDGRRCRSYSLKGATMCAGHAGLGLVADPHAASALAAQKRTELKERRMLVGAGAKMGPRAALRLAALTKAQPLAERILATALDPETGPAGANVALRVLDAIDPLVEVSTVTSTSALIEKVQRGGDPSWSELRAVFGEGGSHGLPEAPEALPAVSA